MHVFHNAEFWSGYRFVPAPLPNIVVGRDHNCMTNFTEKLTAKYILDISFKH